MSSFVAHLLHPSPGFGWLAGDCEAPALNLEDIHTPEEELISLET